MRVMDETLRPMYEDIMRGIRGGSCLLRRKMSFDSDISQLLLENANEKELGEYVGHMLLFDLGLHIFYSMHGAFNISRSYTTIVTN